MRFAKCFAGVCLAFAMTIVAMMVMPGCATFKNVVRTIDDVASGACILFAQQSPAEFQFMVETLAPPAAQKSELSIKDACAIHEVLKPFIDAQLELQQETAASVRQSMQSPNAVPPQ